LLLKDTRAVDESFV